MAERNPFDRNQETSRAEHVSGEGLRRVFRCEDWEALLADALDGLLQPTEGEAFSEHSNSCKICAQLLAHAKQGQEWLQFLHEEPAMPGDMVERILSKTSGAVAERPLAVFGAPIPAGGPTVMGLPMRRMVWDTRLMMTAAMAFFSIALTLNLAGVRITDLRLSSFTPANLENGISHRMWAAKIQAVQYYENLRLVYEVESKIREMRQDEDTAPAAQPSPQQKPVSNPPANHKTGGKLEVIPAVQPPDVLWGHPVLASITDPNDSTSCANPQSGRNENVSGNRDEVETLVVSILDQAERSLA
jgi:hypothetical protein